ncbi:ATP-binding protein [Parvularcula sp. LCG005]|uniref:ATP-binding protein n=1 Tax=Parvularcula sp. LCG005 TaxID=3078805 RepID=UPI00294245F4|nr:DUF87 domain-containing protein [Parvularcula sp. LCG005]WOI54187.1 DUF87 domain-containing protein [Parvularcula sp. LCG005]
MSTSVVGRTRLGRVVANTGRDILVMIDISADARRAVRLGDMVIIAGDGQSTVGVVSGMNAPAPGLESDGDDLWIAQVELAGTLGTRADAPVFSQSIPLPPALGDIAYKAAPTDLRRLFRNGDDTAYPFGVILGQHDVAATIDGVGLVEGGFTIFGASGSGKSCSMASLVRALLRHRHEVNTLLIDPYNEFGRSFGKAAVCIRPEPGLIPHWLLSFEELLWVLSLNGGPLDADERSALEEGVPAARVRFLQRGTRHKDGSTVTTHTGMVSADAPLPYRITDLLAYLEKNAQSDDIRHARTYRRLRTRLLTASGDPRLSVIFGNIAPTDNLAELVKRLFRLEANSPPMSVLQLGTLTAGVDKLVVSVVCRLATALAEWGGGNRRTLILLDDAARFAPEQSPDEAAALSLNALIKLGGRPKKLGTTIGVVASDPRSLSREVTAQCSTFFVHRISSQLEIEAVEDMLPEAAGAYLAAVSNLGTGEAIGVGRGVPLAGRMAISPLPAAAIPTEHVARPPGETIDFDAVEAMVQRWRSCGNFDGTDADFEAEAPLPPPPAVDPGA